MNLADKIALFSAIGGWVSGIATVAAVSVSLYLANRKPRISIKCRVGLKIILSKSYAGMDVRENGLAITVINQSVVPITVNNIHWEIGQETVLHQLFGDTHSASCPKKLEYGEEALFWIKNEGDEWLCRFSAQLKGQNAKMRKLKCCINLSTGQTFAFRPDKVFLDKLSEQILSVETVSSSLQRSE
ncbi:TPA: hypothetical protein SJ157_000283 [Yersinia enterocolitica]|nr:hypothetical protein [Yersinia enterocolitica]HEI6714428.1 hypothetical protein [Yersinia enterocolitica]